MTVSKDFADYCCELVSGVGSRHLRRFKNPPGSPPKNAVLPDGYYGPQYGLISSPLWSR